MSRKASTTATLQIRVVVPTGSNIAELTSYIRVAIASYGGGLAPDNPYFNLKEEHFTVSLVKKETVYV